MTGLMRAYKIRSWRICGDFCQSTESFAGFCHCSLGGLMVNMLQMYQHAKGILDESAVVITTAARKNVEDHQKVRSEPSCVHY